MYDLTTQRNVGVPVISERGTAIEWRVFREYQSGAATESLAQKFRRLPADILRLVKRMRAHQIQELPLSYVHHEEFSRIRRNPAVEEAVLGPRPSDGAPQPVCAPSSVPAYLANVYKIPRLTRSQENHLFRKMNYLKYKASMLRERLDPRLSSSALMDEIEDCHASAIALRNQIVRANLWLVVSVARQVVGPMDINLCPANEPGPTSAGFDPWQDKLACRVIFQAKINKLLELVSDGNMTLMRAVEEFDFAQENRFSVWAVEAIENTFAPASPAEHRRRLRTNREEKLLVATKERRDPSMQQDAGVQGQSVARRTPQRHDPQLRQINMRRFGL